MAGAENLALLALSGTATLGVYCSDQTFRGFHNRAEVLLLTVAIPNDPVINQQQVFCVILSDALFYETFTSEEKSP